MPGYNTTGGHAAFINIRFDQAPIIDAVRIGVNVAAFAAAEKARQLVPVRRVFYGHRTRAPRFITLAEARLELPELHRLGGAWAEATADSNRRTGRAGVRVTDGFRVKSNSWARTGDSGTFFRQHGFAKRAVEANEALEATDIRSGPTPGGYFMPEISRKDLTARGVYELESGRAVVRNMLGGGLLKSIVFHPAKEMGHFMKASVSAGNQDVDYASYVEFGTRHAAAQPFMRPGLKVAAARLRSDVVEALRRR